MCVCDSMCVCTYVCVSVCVYVYVCVSSCLCVCVSESMGISVSCLHVGVCHVCLRVLMCVRF